MPPRKTNEGPDDGAPIKKPAAAKKPAAKAAAKPKSATAAKAPAKPKAAAKPKTAAKPRAGTAASKAKSSAASAARREAPTGFGSGKNLVIVESPAKAKTLQKYLGSDYRIEASVGHVKDLPPSKIGVDVANGFEPVYEIMKGKEKVMDRIRKSAASAKAIYLAPDPDREGEAIAFHIADELGDLGPGRRVMRATFNEITKKAVQAAIDNPRELNHDLYMAQQARRVLDRLVGYQISPLLWKKVTRGLSAGRVQSVAVRLVVEREREIDAFNPEEYWSLEADVAGPTPPPFAMRLTKAAGAKAEPGTAAAIRDVLAALGATGIEERAAGQDEPDPDADPLDAKPAAGRPAVERRILVAQLPGRGPWTVASVEKKDVKRRAQPPFITSTLQQEASRKLGFGAKRTMGAAQRLYEGMDIGHFGQTALITYMRTDSTRVSPDAIAAVRDYIGKQYGAEYVPAQPNFFRTKKDAQDAHEAVRPVDLTLAPEMVAPFLESDHLRLYTLIWNRFVASQMAEARFEQTRVESEPVAGYVFTATGLVQKFPGYLAVYEEGFDDAPARGKSPAGDDAENPDGPATGTDGRASRLPALQAGDKLAVAGLRADQHFTQPPPRFTEASLVKDLEKRGIGRPSTYASIVTTIQDKDYVAREDGKRFKPTELGITVNDILVESFPEVLDSSFTAKMEERLDDVEEGTADWRNVLGEFYVGFKARLDTAAESMKDMKREETPTDIPCDKCGEANFVIKWGRNGKFMACPRYPECKNTRNIARDGMAEEPAAVEPSDELCDLCGKAMVIRRGRTGSFHACTGYPDCKGTKAMKTGVKCPKCGDGNLVERMSKRGKMFYSCDTYPKCDHAEWNRPIPIPCPECQNAYMLLKEGVKRRAHVCPNPDCKHTIALPDRETAE